MSVRSPPLYSILTLIAMQGHQNHNLLRNTVSLGVQYILTKSSDLSNMVLEKGKVKLG